MSVTPRDVCAIVLGTPRVLPTPAQQVTVVVDGAVCIQRSRKHLAATPDTAPWRVFREEGSSLLGTTVTWESGHWVWSPPGLGAKDAESVRKLLAMACPPGPDLQRRLKTADPGVRNLARSWGFLKEA